MTPSPLGVTLSEVEGSCPTGEKMHEETKPRTRESLEVTYDDERRETIIIKRLSNTDMIKWADTGLDKAFLVFRSVEFSSAGVSPANQLWFDTLSQDSAFAVVEKALALNYSPIQKKMLSAVLA